LRGDRQQLPLPCDAVFDLAPDPHGLQTGPLEYQAIGMEYQAGGSTLDVNGPAVVAVPADVGDKRIGLLVAFTQGAEIAQGLFKPLQFAGQPGQLPLGSLHLLACSGDPGPARGQLILLADQEPGLGFQAEPQVAKMFLRGLNLRGRGRGFALNGFDPADDILLFAGEQVVQLAPPRLPFRLAGGLLSGSAFGVLGHGARGGLLGLGTRHGLGAPVDDQQEQDQRSHGAQKDRQEGER